MLAASLCFALMGACVKLVSRDIPVGEVVFLRSLVASLFGLLAGIRLGPRLLGVSRGLLVTRGLVGVAAIFTYFYSLSQLRLGDAVVLNYLNPILVALFAPLTLGERPSRMIWIALLLGFAGVWAVAEGQGGETALPEGHSLAAGVVSGLVSALLSAFAYLGVRRLSRTDPAPTVVLWYSVVATLVAAVTLPGHWVTPGGGKLWLGLAGVGTFAGVAQLLMTEAYASAGAAEISVYSYATPVLAYLLGNLFQESPGWSGMAGATLLVLAGLTASLFGQDRSAYSSSS